MDVVVDGTMRVDVVVAVWVMVNVVVAAVCGKW